MIVTLDNNCIIAVENGEEPNATTIRLLADHCRQHQHTIAVYSYLFLENRPPASERHELPNFPRRLTLLGLGPIELLRPPMSYHLVEQVNSMLFPFIPYAWEDFLMAECAREGVSWEDMSEVEREYSLPWFPSAPTEATSHRRSTLSPERRQELQQFRWKRHRKWNNTRSDVLALCAHIAWALTGIFVTADQKDFHQHKNLLQQEFPGLRIMTPDEAYLEVALEAQSEQTLYTGK